MFVFSTMAAAAPCERPSFRGDVYAASIRNVSFGEAVVYWVFDRDSFTEYLYRPQSGETELIASARYTQVDGAYRIHVPNTRRVGPGRQATDAMPPVIAFNLKTDDGGLLLPNGERLTRVVESSQWIPEIQSADPGRRIGITSTNDTCCCNCWSTHDFLGISFLDEICCFWSGGCDDASGFCGGGGGSSW